MFPLVCRSGALSLTRLCTLSPLGGFPSLMGSGTQEGLGSDPIEQTGDNLAHFYLNSPPHSSVKRGILIDGGAIRITR